MGSELPGPWEPPDSKGSKDTTGAKILTEVSPPLRWQQLEMTPVSSVTSQETSVLVPIGVKVQ